MCKSRAAGGRPRWDRQTGEDTHKLRRHCRIQIKISDLNILVIRRIQIWRPLKHFETPCHFTQIKTSAEVLSSSHHQGSTRRKAKFSSLQTAANSPNSWRLVPVYRRQIPRSPVTQTGRNIPLLLQWWGLGRGSAAGESRSKGVIQLAYESQQNRSWELISLHHWMKPQTFDMKSHFWLAGRSVAIGYPGSL